VAAGARAVLDGLTLANGMSSADAGCVLVEAGGTITITNSMMTNCGTNGDGGALHLAEGVTCTILKSVLDNCVASGSGGGIYMLGSFLWLSHSSIRRCAGGSCTSGCNGGALCATDSDVWMMLTGAFLRIQRGTKVARFSQTTHECQWKELM